MRTLIIAEAGVNHNGDIEIAKQLIVSAADAGADYVKFQTFKAEKIVSYKAKKADYQSLNLNDDQISQYEMLKRLELSHSDHIELKGYAEKQGIKFTSSPFDVESINYLQNIGIDLFKCPSGEITNYPYLKALAQTGSKLILSTGMANYGEIESAIQLLIEHGLKKENLTVLHCNTQYPTPMEDVNLHAMNSIKAAFDVNVGYSDHTLGIEVPTAAVALGASVIEKHFTLDRTMEGPDHVASLEPNELKDMVRAIRNIEKATSGSGIKEVSPSEIKNKQIARKSIHIIKPLKKGEEIIESNLISLRPGDGISPMEWERILGKKVTTDLEANHMLDWRDISN
ncbi:N-acetylneuraminate synthase [Mangrovivirga sp. M17]|uniref:N-acetylneuraminate synthase n=1 Tax=Mangrovivirga halotolerans TaxID=2993936 RepID=A0ABT3RTS1_9BACT|nr:N-acetylneuraminate synthase [Mangrovivirga halotolerans]MCX2745187.1 N-acetylneuraminate synthase [Mangrovivirga halotolerans]